MMCSKSTNVSVGSRDLLLMIMTCLTRHQVDDQLKFDDEGNLQFETSADEGDLLYDDIGSVLKIKQLQNTKSELLEALETYYRVFFLGEDWEEEE